LRGYEITERGKIVIAVIIAIPLFIIAITLAVIAWNNTQSPPDDPPSHSESHQPEEDPEISDKPLPDGSGFTPHEPPEPDETEHGEQGEFDPDLSEDPPDEIPDISPVSVDLSAGTMLFWFSPDDRDSLSDSTVDKIGEFLTSPKNTSESQIVIEMPKLPDDELSELISAVTDAFAKHGISHENLAYATYSIDPSDESFEINLYFLTASVGK